MDLDDNKLRTRLLRREMTRDRSLQDYNQLLGLDIVQMATRSCEIKGYFVWYDLCCGSFEAGRGLIEKLYYDGPDLIPKVRAVGIDLDTTFPDDYELTRGVIIRRGNVATATFPDADLVTSLRGLRYVDEYLHTAPQAVETWYNSMPVGSLLAFDTCLLEPDVGYKPIMVQGIPLWQILKNHGAQVGRFHSDIEKAFTVKILRTEKDLKL